MTLQASSIYKASELKKGQNVIQITAEKFQRAEKCREVHLLEHFPSFDIFARQCH